MVIITFYRLETQYLASRSSKETGNDLVMHGIVGMLILGEIKNFAAMSHNPMHHEVVTRLPSNFAPKFVFVSLLTSGAFLTK